MRWTGAVFAGAAAVAWVAERALHVRNPLAGAVDALSAHSLVALVTLAGFAAVATLWTQASGRRAAL